MRRTRRTQVNDVAEVCGNEIRGAAEGWPPGRTLMKLRKVSRANDASSAY